MGCKGYCLDSLLLEESVVGGFQFCSYLFQFRGFNLDVFGEPCNWMLTSKTETTNFLLLKAFITGMDFIHKDEDGMPFQNRNGFMTWSMVHWYLKNTYAGFGHPWGHPWGHCGVIPAFAGARNSNTSPDPSA